MEQFHKSVLFAFAFSAPFSLSVAEELVTTFTVLKPEVAYEVARATMTACREAGYQVSVAVVDRSGVTQVLLRDQLAGPHTLDTARRKAWTSASFRADSRAVGEATRPGNGQSGARFVTDAMMVGGGIPLYAASTVVGAVGVSGSPDADEDQVCAEAGAAALEEKLLF